MANFKKNHSKEIYFWNICYTKAFINNLFYLFFGIKEIIKLTNWLHNYKVNTLKKQVVTIINFLLGISLTAYEISLLKFFANIWAQSVLKKLIFIQIFK